MNPVRNKKSKIFTDTPKASLISNGMKILIGTPIHEIKDYCMEQWLTNVAKLQEQTPADLLLVDNSPGLDYIKKVKKYCEKYGVKNYKILHLNLEQSMEVYAKCRRIDACHERISKEVSRGKYDAWFSWECDQIIPATTLSELVKIMQIGNFMMVIHNSWTRQNDRIPNFDMGCTLLSRKALELQSFIKDNDEDECFKEKILAKGGNYVQITGLLRPIYHLDPVINVGS